MIVQVDGWSGSGKSILLYLLDGHPALYVHPFHDIITSVFNEKDANRIGELLDFDLIDMRNRFADRTQIYKTESFIRQRKYVIEFRKHTHVNVKLDLDFSKIDDEIATNFIKNQNNLTHQWIVENVYQAFSNSIYNGNSRKIFIGMGNWNTNDNWTYFNKLYPEGKCIIVKKKKEDIAAAIIGRMPMEIDYRSKNFNNRRLQDLIKNEFFKGYEEYYGKAEFFCKQYPDKYHLVDIDNIFNNKRQELSKICNFLKIQFDEIIMKSSFFGTPVELSGIDYSEVLFDRGTDVFSEIEIKKINKKQSLDERRKTLNHIGVRLLKSLIKRIE
jgi:hypothetical protein